MSLPAILANVTLHQLNFTATCSNLALGLQVWHEFGDEYGIYAIPGNSTHDNETMDDGPGGSNGEYQDFWTNGTALDWIAFWRTALGSVVPTKSLTDNDVANWANTTESFYFFDDNYFDIEIDPLNLQIMANVLAFEQGCKANFTNITNIVQMEEACMVHYCCSSDTNSTVTHSPNEKFPYFQNWTVEDACAFNTCQQENQGNPDLGGIGVLVAYLIEGSLLAFNLIMYGIKLFTDYFAGSRPKKDRKLHNPYDKALLASSGVFLDTSAYFALSVCFAAVIFNYKDNPLLYEDKLGQASTLLTIDAPVATALLSYQWLDRRDLRIFLAIITALMTFIIQFMFRRAKSFNPGSNLCLDWDSYVEDVFQDRFIVKAIWACLVLSFFVYKVIPWHYFQRAHPEQRPRRKFPQWLRIWQRIPFWRGLVDSKLVLKTSNLCTAGHKMLKRLPRERLVAYILAIYALYDTFYDIRFLMFLRNQEKAISSTKDAAEDEWGYGQILAVFVWVPVIVEYFYVLGNKLGWWGSKVVKMPEKEGEHRYEMIDHERPLAKGDTPRFEEAHLE
ncbi:hypothetical protein P7C71_g2468, partial [Lecanoromycetidae sp. Uapishka_2]